MTYYLLHNDYICINIEGISTQIKVDQYCQHCKKKSGQKFSTISYCLSIYYILLYGKCLGISIYLTTHVLTYNYITILL